MYERELRDPGFTYYWRSGGNSVVVASARASAPAGGNSNCVAQLPPDIRCQLSLTPLLLTEEMESNDGISSVESLVLRRHAEEFERADLTPSLGVLRANYLEILRLSNNAYTF